jgi:hypothetical protein
VTDLPEQDLVHEELSVLKRAEQLARREQIDEVIDPETKHGGDRKSKAARSNGKE